MQLLSISNVSLDHDGVSIFKNISLNLNTGDRLGIIGPNGAGKSSFINGIENTALFSGGNISITKGAKIGKLSQTWKGSLDITVRSAAAQSILELLRVEEEISSTQSNLTINFNSASDKLSQLEYTFETLGGFEKISQVDKVLNVFGFPKSRHNQQVHELSGGERTKMMLVQLIISEPEVLLLDEPTNHLDIEAVIWLENWVKSYKKSIICISHDRYFLDQTMNKTLEIENGNGWFFNGNYSQFVINKENSENYAQFEQTRQLNEMKTLETYVQKNKARASTAKMAKSREKRLNRMKAEYKAITPKAKTMNSIQFTTKRQSGKDVLKLTDVSCGYDAAIINNINLEVKKGESIAIIGGNGVGKTTLMKSIAQHIPLLQGELRVGANVDFSYYDQNHDQLNSNQSIYKYTHDNFPELTDEKIRTVLGKFLFSKEDVEKSLSTLSGGEKARVALANISNEHGNTLLFDEPTNHLDINTRERLEDALIAFDGTLLFISHDRYFINRIATSVWEVSKSGVAVYNCDYDTYLEQISAKKTLKSVTSPTLEPTKTPTISNNKKNEYIKFLGNIELQIESAEREIKDLHNEMNINATDYILLTELNYLLAEKTALLETLELKWLEYTEEMTELGIEH